MATPSTQQTFDLALQHHQAGRLREAEALYRQVLKQKPFHFNAMHLLGVIANQVGRNDLAVELIRRAIAFNPNFPEALSNLGKVLMDEGKLDESIEACRKAVALRPGFAEAYGNLGNALTEKGETDEAIAAFDRALSLRPKFPEALNGLAVARLKKGEPDEAITACRAAIALRPDYAEVYGTLGDALQKKGELDEAIATYRKAIRLRLNLPRVYNSLGVALLEKGEVDEAVAASRKAIALKPDYPEALSNLGNALKKKGQLDEAIAAYRQAIGLRPGVAEIYNNLGSALRDKGRLDEAAAAYRKAFELKPGVAEFYASLGNVLLAKGQVDEAIVTFREAVALNGDYAEAHFNLGFALLLRGDFERGLSGYAWRWKTPGFPPRALAQPQWSGEPVESRTILVHAEQGLGDTIQFLRYVPLLIARGAKVLLGVPEKLRQIAEGAAGTSYIVKSGEPLPPFDLHCPMLDLPGALGTRLDSIPKNVPYVFAGPSRAEAWRQRLSDAGPGLKVGLAWAGSPTHKNDRNRSIAISQLEPLARVGGAHLISLQKGEAAQQAAKPPVGFCITDWTGELDDFADTAALLANLDLVICVDTAVAHLAGAMARPVWLMLPFAPDWRWMLEREDSPWYPTMRLFRQTSAGNWEGVVRRVVEELRKRVVGD